MLPKLISKSLLVFLLLLTPLATRGYYSPGKPSGFMNDYARMLSAEERQSLEAKLDNFEKETSNEIAVVTIESLQGDTVENFAVKLFEEWGIGKKEKDNGALVLVAKDDRRMRIEVGYGLEGALTDAQSFWITESIMKPAFRTGDYYAGIDGAVDKIVGATRGEYVPSDIGSESNGKVSNVFGWFWIGFFLLTFLSAVLGRTKSWWGGGIVGGVIGLVVGLVSGFLFMGLISLIVLIPLGLLFDFLVSRSYGRAKETGHYPWWFGGGRGGFGGGGGFGGFGGGHSGGGGSSNSW